MTKTDEIAARLRGWASYSASLTYSSVKNDATAILDERDRLYAALWPFACKCASDFCADAHNRHTERCHYYRARAALESKP